VRDLHVLHGEYGPGLPYSCTYIRLLQPLSHPLVSSHLSFTHGTQMRKRSDPDLVVVERQPPGVSDGPVPEAERLVRTLAERRVPFVFATDDNLLDLNRDRPWEAFPEDELRAAVRLLARRAAGVVVSTEALAERFRRLNPRTVVVPNAIDERLFGPPGEVRRRGVPFTIGYMGTRTHDRDLRMVLGPLRNVLARAAGAVRLEVVGVVDEASLAAYFEGLPVARLDPGTDEAYPRFPGWMRRSLRWDLALAPLEVDDFTICKSDLKYLDYGALGIPGLFSDVRPYRETIRHGETGLLVPDARAAWEEAIEGLIADEPRRQRLAEAARDEVYRSRTLATQATRWLEAFTELMPGPSEGTPRSGRFPTGVRRRI